MPVSHHLRLRGIWLQAGTLGQPVVMGLARRYYTSETVRNPQVRLLVQVRVTSSVLDQMSLGEGGACLIWHMVDHRDRAGTRAYRLKGLV